MITLNIFYPHWSSFHMTAFFISYFALDLRFWIMGMGIDGEMVQVQELQEELPSLFLFFTS
jgi:hypothetical protein